MTIDLQSYHEVWAGVAGAMIALLRSIIDGTRRTWYQLIIGCILGALGAGIAGHIYEDSKWVYPICGVAAIMTEGVVLGLFNASQEFRRDPFRVFSNLYRLVVPSFGKVVGDSISQPARVDQSPESPNAQ